MASRQNPAIGQALTWFGLILAVGGGCLCPQAWGQAAPSAEVSSTDFVFLVDTSFSMARQRSALTNALTSLILSGLNGRIRTGQKLSVWTFNEDVHSRRLSGQVWTPEQSQALAERALQILKNQRFEKRTRLDAAVREILRALQASPAMTIFLFSDGDERISGTPFDRNLNRFYQELGRASRQARQPLITTFVARDGRLLDWAVSVAGGPITIPESAGLTPRDALRPVRTQSAADTLRLSETPSPPAPPPIVGETKSPPVSPRPPPPRAEIPKPSPVSAAGSPVVSAEKNVEPRPAPLEASSPPPGTPAGKATPEPSSSETVRKEASPRPESSMVPAHLPAVEVKGPPRSQVEPQAESAIPAPALGRTTGPVPVPSSLEPAALPPARADEPAGGPRREETGSAMPKIQGPPPAVAAVSGPAEHPLDSDAALRRAAPSAASEATPPQSALAVAVEPTANSPAPLFAAIGLLFVASGLVYWHFRKGHSEPRSSLISRSLDRSKE